MQESNKCLKNPLLGNMHKRFANGNPIIIINIIIVAKDKLYDRRYICFWVSLELKDDYLAPPQGSPKQDAYL